MKIKPLKHKLFRLFLYFTIVSSLLTIGFTGSYFSDIETSSGCSFIGGTWIVPDCPPHEPADPVPRNNALHILENPTLQVYVSDPNSDPMNVSFYNSLNDSLIDAVTNVSSNTTISVIWHGLECGSTYQWYAIAEDLEGATQSNTWCFTVNYPPDVSKPLLPLDEAIDVVLSPTLEIHISDSDGDTVNVSFYDASDGHLLGQNINVSDGENASIIWNDLEYGHTYKWYVIAYDGIVETRSSTWCFTTKAIPGSSGGGNSDGDTNSDDNNTSENNLPIADAGGPYYSYASELVMFDGSNSFDPDGAVISYHWDFGDGTNTTEANATTNHSYEITKTYNVTLIVTDNNGTTNISTTTATITERNPEINSITATPLIQIAGKYVNITCTIVNVSLPLGISINITNPLGNSSNHPMNNNVNNSYCCNLTYDDLGAYSYFIQVCDINNNTVTSDIHQFFIGDNTKPEIKDNTAAITYTNDNLTFDVNVIDCDCVTSVAIEYWYNGTNHTNILLNHDGSRWKNQIMVENTLGELHYIVRAYDLLNVNISNIRNITILDNDKPMISDTTTTPVVQEVNKSVNITVNATDNIEIKNVTLHITNPDNSTIQVSMSNIANTDTYYYNATYSQIGTYNYNVEVADTSNNIIASNLCSFDIQ